MAGPRQRGRPRPHRVRPSGGDSRAVPAPLTAARRLAWQKTVTERGLDNSREPSQAATRTGTSSDHQPRGGGLVAVVYAHGRDKKSVHGGMTARSADWILPPWDFTNGGRGCGQPGRCGYHRRGPAKHYGRFTAVENVSFSIRSGAITGFFGPNGAGKTTALKVISGIARASAGQVLLNGHEAPARDAHTLGAFIGPCGAPSRALGAHTPAFVGDHGRTAARAGVRGAGAGGPRAGRASQGREVLARHAPRLGLAAALLADPDILVLDEPTNGLDPQGIRWLRTLLRERADSGCTVVLSPATR
ncbi:ATP-binding cassette domain-containing protein [Parafrankia elaeagni]|uniref:ATP-binding cassette domain-containing protein n=1 Tax=Parafrankia elaeagni TaxID=222534 RepID=UPI0038991C45